MEMVSEDKVKRVASALITLGIESAKGQALLRRWVEVDPHVALRACAYAHKTLAVRAKLLPPDAGILTHQLLEIAEESASELAARVWVNGSPLTRFFDRDSYRQEIVRYWRQDFAPPIPDTVKLGALDEEEHNARQTVAVQAVAQKLKQYISEGKIGAPSETDFEIICMHLTRIALMAYDEPNRFNHKHLHGQAKEGPEGPPKDA